MPYGHIKQYEDLVKEARKKRIKLTRDQEKQIAKLYQEIADRLESELKKHSKRSLSYRWLEDYAKQLKKNSRSLYRKIESLVTENMERAATDAVQAEEKFWGDIDTSVSERFSDVFSRIPQQAVDELMNGGIYKDFSGLSERIWAYQKKYQKGIDTVINEGILAQKSAYDLAKDLEIYLNPKAKKPWDWSKVYPKSDRKIDYNAQRLARTSVTHAYQLSFERATKDNPFIEKYKWLSSNSGRVCPICTARNGRLFNKNSVPLDHPNGMCTLVAVITKSREEIAQELADWANGKENSALDKWLNPTRKSDIIDYENTPGVLKKETKYIDKPIEYGMIYRPDGKLVREIKGKSGMNIQLSSADKLIVKGCIFSHNHPNDSLPSPADIYSLWEYQLAEVRAVTKKYGIYRIKQPGTWKQVPESQNKLNHEYLDLQNKFSSAVARRLQSNVIQPSEADHLIQRIIIRRITRKYGLELEVIPWKK